MPVKPITGVRACSFPNAAPLSLGVCVEWLSLTSALLADAPTDLGVGSEYSFGYVGGVQNGAATVLRRFVTSWKLR